VYAGARAPYGVQLQPDKDGDEDKKVMREHTPEVIVVFLWMCWVWRGALQLQWCAGNGGEKSEPVMVPS
jgi:hypothetical protein